MENLREKRLFRRFRIQAHIDISLRSIGSKHPYTFKTGNISSGGVFVQCENNKCPFSPQSILESAMFLEDIEDPEKKIEVAFVGKVAHMRGKNGFGIKIVQIDPDVQELLNEYINDYAGKFPERLL